MATQLAAGRGFPLMNRGRWTKEEIAQTRLVVTKHNVKQLQKLSDEIGQVIDELSKLEKRWHPISDKLRRLSDTFEDRLDRLVDFDEITFLPFTEFVDNNAAGADDEISDFLISVRELKVAVDLTLKIVTAGDK